MQIENIKFCFFSKRAGEINWGADTPNNIFIAFKNISKPKLICQTLENYLYVENAVLDLN